jgi:GAF domain-containing protein
MVESKHNDAVVAIRALVDAMVKAADVTDVYRLALEQAVQLTGASHSAINLYSNDYRKITFPVRTGLPAEIIDFVERMDVTANPLHEELIRAKQPVVISDVRQAGFTSELREMLTVAGIGSLALLPLRAHSEIVGTLCLARAEIDGFIGMPVDRLQIIADVVAHTTVQSRLRLVAQIVCLGAEHHASATGARWRNEYLTRLERLAVTLWTQTSLEQLFEAVAGSALQVLEADIATVALITKSREVTYVAAVGDGFLKGNTVSFEQCPLSDWVVSRGMPLLITDIESDWRTRTGVLRQLNARSLISAPLESKGQVTGVVTVLARTRIFNAVQLQMLHLLAHQATVVLAKIKLDQELRESHARLDEWCKHLQRLSELNSEEASLQHGVEALCEVLHARYGAIALLDENGALKNFVHFGLSPEEAARIGARPTGKGILGAFLVEGKPLRLADITLDPRAAGFPQHHPVMKSFLGVPILSRDRRVLGRVYLTEKSAVPHSQPRTRHLRTTSPTPWPSPLRTHGCSRRRRNKPNSTRPCCAR